MAGLSIAGPVPAAGVWNASTNTPTLVNGTGVVGTMYRVSVTGTRNLGAGTATYTAGEYIIYRSGTWQKVPNGGRSVETRQNTETRLQASGITVDSVSARVDQLVAASKITKNEVTVLDAGFATTDYYTGQDALLVPTSAKAAPGGVASLGADTKVPGAQVPAKGNGTFRGPWGATTVLSGTAQQTPVKIAEWNIGATAMTFRPLIYLQAFVQVSNRARPAIEVRLGDATQTTYASQTLVAAGFGRSMFDDYQCVTVLPAAPNSTQLNGVQPSWGGGFNLRLTAWLFNTASSGSVALNNQQLANACVYLAAVGA
jgi:hypothetical protein